MQKQQQRLSTLLLVFFCNGDNRCEPALCNANDSAIQSLSANCSTNHACWGGAAVHGAYQPYGSLASCMHHLDRPTWLPSSRTGQKLSSGALAPASCHIIYLCLARSTQRHSHSRSCSFNFVQNCLQTYQCNTGDMDRLSTGYSTEVEPQICTRHSLALIFGTRRSGASVSSSKACFNFKSSFQLFSKTLLTLFGRNPPTRRADLSVSCDSKAPMRPP